METYKNEYGLVVPRNNVMELMRVIDEDGVERRRKRRLLKAPLSLSGTTFSAAAAARCRLVN